MLDRIDNYLKEWFLEKGLAEKWAIIWRDTFEIIVVILIGIIAFFIARKILVAILQIIA